MDLDAEVASDETTKSGPMTAAPMSEAAVAAKRSFDRENWRRAARLLHDVATGKSNDDGGNRQFAEYNLAIARYRIGDLGGAMDIFAAIASHSHHIRFRESLLWLAKLSTHTEVALRAADALRNYESTFSARRGNPKQSPLFHRLQFMTGRAFYRRGRYDAARKALRLVAPNTRHYALAQRCLALVDKAAG